VAKCNGCWPSDRGWKEFGFAFFATFVVESHGMDSFLVMLALVGAVIVISALLSGWVDRTGVPQVAVFLGMGRADWTLWPRHARCHGRLAHSAGSRHALAGAGSLH
jgi:hypothetical protein